MKKRAFTLIEMIIAMALVFLLLGVVDSMMISHLKKYKSDVLQNRGFNYLNEAIAMIQREVNLDATEVITEGNIIKIKYSDGSTINHIKCINSCLYILYGTVYLQPKDNSNKNLIIDDVKDFVATKSGKILYIKIIWKSGQSIERGLVIENAN
ncbi:type II secretion system protein [Clostridium sp.]|uniref:type II secretion system protein n=1 Tax=Clostridium sp. TaxID=1506 RepID=UPI001A5858AF|nr:type II secretion system protein [Clostridium sp.]MBK5241296.1 type II secretion system protein [Clostridium sp.]